MHVPRHCGVGTPCHVLAVQAITAATQPLLPQCTNVVTALFAAAVTKARCHNVLTLWPPFCRHSTMAPLPQSTNALTTLLPPQHQGPPATIY
jgi:hypothetical protein